MERGIKLPGNSAEWGFKGENYLLIIGIDKYTHWKPLNNAVKDIRDIIRMLTERYQFDADHVRSLTDDDATEDNIRLKLLDVKKTITPNDNLIVYYSGHGHYDEDLDEGYWVPANARKDNPSDYISNSDVLKWIRAIKTHHTLVIVDSCFSGTLVSQSRSEVLSEKYPSSRIFASGRKELVDDGTPGTNSPFAKAILGRLSRNTDRALRASELIQNVTKIVESESGQAPIEGRMKDAGDEGGEFVFHLKVTEDEIWNAVVGANTPDEYGKYLEYFPDGKYTLEARTKLSSLTDETDWRKALDTSTPAGLATYLEAHPRGAHYEEAFRKLEELEENDAWQNAKTRNSVSAYMEYLRKYPSGRFTAPAKKNLDSLKGVLKQHEQDLVIDELADIEDKSNVITDNKTRFKTLLNEAEGLYAQMNYDACIEKYRAALKLYEAHFVPDKRFIEARIREAERHVTFIELIEDGKKAVTDGNFELALQFFRKARTIDDTAKVREWITHAEKKLKGDFEFTPVKPKPPVKNEPQKKSNYSWIGWTLGAVILGVIAIVIYSVTSSAKDMGNAYNKLKDDYAYDNSNVSTDESDAVVPEQNVQPVFVGDYVPGQWNVSDRVVNSVSVAAAGLLNPASWDFQTDGGVTYWENGYSYPGSWNLEQKGESFTSTITVPSININGYFYQIDQYNITIITTEVTGQVYNYLVRGQ